MDKHTATASTTINAPAQKVWDHLTKPELVKELMFGTNLETDWKPGSPISFKGEWKGKAYEDKGKVVEFTPAKTLAYTYWSNWSGTEDKPENYQLVRYDLEEKDGATKVAITQETASQEQADHSETNWKQMLDALKNLAEK